MVVFGNRKSRPRISRTALLKFYHSTVNTVIGVKENICELLDVIDDIKHDISNNNYIKCMGFLKNINDKLQKEDNQ